MATKKGPGAIKPPTKLSLLSKEDKVALQEEARKSVLAEMEQDARDEYFQKALKEARRAHTPSAQIVNVSVDLAPFLPHIAIDGVMYFHGYSYDVERPRAIVLYEQMQRSWQHQDEIDGRSRFNPYRRAQNVVLGPRHAGQTTMGANGVVSLPEDTTI
ncbi:MAG: hypothetical protein KGL35_24915 [Bradyrhizobium sp.]|nr:hypothetical protein [Bradyrhizobium sp.]